MTRWLAGNQRYLGLSELIRKPPVCLILSLIRRLFTVIPAAVLVT